MTTTPAKRDREAAQKLKAEAKRQRKEQQRGDKRKEVSK